MARVSKRNNVWYVHYKNEAGQWRKKSCGKNAKRSDAEFIANKYSSMELNRHHKAPVKIIKEPLEVALEKYIKEFLYKNVSSGKQVSSVKREVSIVGVFKEFLDSRYLNRFHEIDTTVMVDFFKARSELGRKPNTLTKEHRVLNNFFKWSIANNFCIGNPMEEMQRPKKTRGKPKYFDESELKKLFAGSNYRYCQVYKFLYLTGLRAGELGNLLWEDIDWARALIHIRVTTGNKKKEESTVPLNRDALQVLKDRLQYKDEDIANSVTQELMHRKGYSKEDVPDAERYVFVNEHYNKLDSSNIYRNLKPILKANNMNNCSPHTFRHTFASHLVIKGVSIYVVRDLLRHASVKETEIYAHLAPDNRKEAVNLLSA